MQLTLYKMTCDKNVVDKSDYFISPDTIYVNGTLRENTNIVNPVVCIKFSNTQDNVPNNWSAPITKMVQYNYCHISEFGRWYFIDDIEWIGNGMHNLYLTIDVLYTFRTSILNLECGVTRNEFKYTPYLPDDMMPVVPLPKQVVEPVSDEMWSYDYTNPSLDYNQVTSTERHYDVSIESHQLLLVTTTRAYKVINPEEEPTITHFGGYISNNLNRNPICSNSYHAYLIGYNFYSSLAYYIYNSSSKSDYIVGLYFLPIKCNSIIESCTKTNSIILGDKTFDGDAEIGAVKFYYDIYEITSKTNTTIDFELFFDIPINSNKFFKDKFEWLSNTQYTKYSLYIPLFGIIDFNPFSFINVENGVEPNLGDVHIVYSLDPFYGTISYSIVTKRGNTYNSMYSDTQTLTQFPITTTNIEELNRNKILSTLSFAVNAGAAIATGGVSILNTQLLGSRYKTGSKNYKKMQSKIRSEQTGIGTDIASGVPDLISAFTQIEHASIKTSNSNILYALNKVSRVLLMYETFSPAITTDIDKYAHIYGLPYCAIETLSNLHGYTVCADFHLDNIYRQYLLNDSGDSKGSIRPVSDELDMIEEYLKTGIILP